MENYIEFNRITYGLPVERFRIEAYIALEERLPVVTEYLLRLLRICGRLPLASIREYFGFTDAEILATIESLSRQGLLEVENDEARLSQFAAEKFDQTGEDYPRFSKVELKSDDVTFDLMTFIPLHNISNNNASDNIIKLEASEESLGRSIERARSAYQNHYHEIASKKSDTRNRAYGIYSIESVESKRKSYVPIPVSFTIDTECQVQRVFDEVFERAASGDLLQQITEQISALVPKSISFDISQFSEFIQTFNMQVFSKYLVGNKFNIGSYVNEVHINQTQKFPKGTKPILGNLYLPKNRELIISRLKRRRQGHQKTAKLSTSLAWLMPDYSLWGRGDSLSETVNTLTDLLREGGSFDDLYLCAYADDKNDQQRLAFEYKMSGIKEFHFINTIPSMKSPEKRLFDGKLEILLYPTSFVFVIYHLSLPGTPGLLAPIGFVSTLPKHLDIAHKLLKNNISGERYSGRAQAPHDKRNKPNSFEEAFPFLNYESLLVHHAEHDDPDDDLVDTEKTL